LFQEAHAILVLTQLFGIGIGQAGSDTLFDIVLFECQPPRSWDHLTGSSATVMGPPLDPPPPAVNQLGWTPLSAREGVPHGIQGRIGDAGQRGAATVVARGRGLRSIAAEHQTQGPLSQAPQAPALKSGPGQVGAGSSQRDRGERGRSGARADGNRRCGVQILESPIEPGRCRSGLIGSHQGRNTLQLDQSPPPMVATRSMAKCIRLVQSGTRTSVPHSRTNRTPAIHEPRRSSWRQSRLSRTESGLLALIEPTPLT